MKLSRQTVPRHGFAIRDRGGLVSLPEGPDCLLPANSVSGVLGEAVSDENRTSVEVIPFDENPVPEDSRAQEASTLML